MAFPCPCCILHIVGVFGSRTTRRFFFSHTHPLTLSLSLPLSLSLSLSFSFSLSFFLSPFLTLPFSLSYYTTSRVTQRVQQCGVQYMPSRVPCRTREDVSFFRRSWERETRPLVSETETMPLFSETRPLFGNEEQGLFSQKRETRPLFSKKLDKKLAHIRRTFQKLGSTASERLQPLCCSVL